MFGLTQATLVSSQSSFMAPRQLQVATPSGGRAAVAVTPVRCSQSLWGKVVSTSQAKTAVVEVATQRIHPIYQKRVRVLTKYNAHDEQELCKIGDTVILAPTRPLSKTKRFIVETIEKKAK